MKHLCGVAALVLGCTTLASANVVYNNAPGNGNQKFVGSLGMDFQVNSNITVSSLGAFDSGQDGFVGPILIQLYDLSNLLTPIASTSTGTGTTGTLIGGSRFYSIAPIVLIAGFQGSIVASGFSASDMNGNMSFPGFTGATTDSLGGAISFIGSSRYGNTTAFPTILDSGPANRYQAGTFVASSGGSTASPEPGTWSFVALGGLLVAVSRRKLPNDAY